MTDSARPTPEQVSAVLMWLARTFEGAQVASEGNFDREVQLFRARLPEPSPVACELEISYEAFEDHDTAAIVKALETQDAANRLQKERRLLLKRSLVLGPSEYGWHGKPNINEYSMLEFPSLEQAQLFVSIVMGYVGTAAGLKWMVDSPHRVVVWQRFRFPPGPSFKKDASTFYVSNGVLQLARALGVPLPAASEKLTHDQLPAERSLLIGQQADWH